MVSRRLIETLQTLIFFRSEPEIIALDVTVPESVGDAEVCATLNNPLEETIMLGYITVDGSAMGNDFLSSLNPKIYSLFFLQALKITYFQLILVHLDQIKERRVVFSYQS